MKLKERDSIKIKKIQKGVTLQLSHTQLKNNHTGGFLPILFAALGAIGALAGGSAAIANAVKTSQHQNAEEAETKRHNAEMEKIAQSTKTLSLGSGVKRTKKMKTLSLGSGVKRTKKKRKHRAIK